MRDALAPARRASLADLPPARGGEEIAIAGITLVAIARHDGFEVFTHPHRIATEAESRLVTNVA